METVLAILAAAFGSGWAIQIAFYRYEKRKRKAEVENVELDLDTKYDELHLPFCKRQDTALIKKSN